MRPTETAVEALIGKLRLIAAWCTPAGPTPVTKCPDKMRVCLEAAELISSLHLASTERAPEPALDFQWGSRGRYAPAAAPLCQECSQPQSRTRTQRQATRLESSAISGNAFRAS